MHDSSSFDFRTAHRLCDAAAAVGMRPVDELLEQASHERRPQWALEAARTIEPDIERALLSGTPEELDRLRAKAKTAFHEAGTVRERNAALVAYAASIAASLDRFRILRTSQPREEVDTLLAGAARCVHAEWAELFDRAIVQHARVRGTQ